MSCVVRTLFGTHRSLVKNRCWMHLKVDSGSEWPEGPSACSLGTLETRRCILDNVFYGFHNWHCWAKGI